MNTKATETVVMRIKSSGIWMDYSRCTPSQALTALATQPNRYLMQHWVTREDLIEAQLAEMAECELADPQRYDFKPPSKSEARQAKDRRTTVASAAAQESPLESSMTRYSYTEVVAHRSTKRLAEKYVASFADELGDTVAWDGSKNVPIHIEWAVVRAEQGFDIVSTVRPADEIDGDVR